MIFQIIAVAVFSLTIISAARDIPPKTKLSGIISAAVLAASDLFLLTRFSAASAEYERLIMFLNENKQASVGMLPKFMTSIAEVIHNAIIGAAEWLSEANEAVLLRTGGVAENAAFIAAALVVSVGVILLVPCGKESSGETVGPAKAIGIIILDMFSGSFLAAPVAAVIMYGICHLIGIEYAAVICTVMWVLSYIPVIGQATGIILGVCVLVAACHPVWGIIFGILSAGVNILLSYGKNVVEGLLEAHSQKIPPGD